MVRRVLVGGMLVAASVPSLGLTLGPMQGQVHFGQPLNLRVPLTLTEGESPDSLCPVVRVLFANDPLPPAVVAVGVAAGESNTSAVLTIATRTALTEPFGRVDVVVGCNNQISRQYTLLTELPSAERPVPLLPQTPVAVAIQAQRAASSNEAGLGSPATDASVQRSAAAAGSVAKAAPRSVVRKSDAATPLTTSKRSREPRYLPPPAELTLPGSRLKLDPVELVAAVTSLAPSLRMTVDLPVAPSDVEKVSDELAQRRDAARALWRALNDSPEQSAAASLKAEALAVEAERLRTELATQKKLGAELEAQLQQERDSLHRQPVVLVGGALLLIAAAAIAVFLRRRSGSEQAATRPWWKRSSSSGEAAGGKPSLMERGRSTLRARTQRPGPLVAAGRDVDIDVDTLFPSDASQSLKAGEPESRVSVPRVDPIGGHSHADFMPSALMDGSRSVATEELFDLQQQVEFFISLGQSDQAIEVLVNHLAESQEPSPLAYLDLLKLYHELGRREDYESLRSDFNRQFNGGAPAFEDYSYSRRGLERYESAVSRIQALWPRPEVLALIERSIFRDGPADVADVFDLEAYRELLLLYGVAREVIGREQPIPAVGAARGSDLLQSETGTTVLQPLQARTPEAREREEERLQAGLADFRHTQIDDSTERVFLDSGLDLDLSEPNDNAEATSSQTSATEETSLTDRDALRASVSETGASDAADGLSFDLPEVTSHREFGDSRFPVKQPASTSSKAVSAAGSVDFDFSDLASLEHLSLKKSGDRTL